MASDLCNGIRDLVAEWTRLQRSDEALQGEDDDALKALAPDAVVALAGRALRTLENLEEYSYLISALQGHLEGPGSHQEGWVVAQADGGDNAGGFNKWAKVQGGEDHRHAVKGSYLVHEDWKDAKAAWSAIPADIRSGFRIYPVVLSAGNEPRTTPPRPPY
jgi:hypothetical protein